jgi:hypothetical protein
MMLLSRDLSTGSGKGADLGQVDCEFGRAGMGLMALDDGGDPPRADNIAGDVLFFGIEQVAVG